MTTVEKEIRKFLKKETRKQRAYLWGNYEVFSPVVLSKIYGDGKQIIWIASIDQRPKFWIVRIDSKQSLDWPDFDCEIYVDAIEEEFGRSPGYMTYSEFKEERKLGRLDVDYLNYKDFLSDCRYPMMYWGGGAW